MTYGFCTLLQPGELDAGCCEKMADDILCCPRCLWLGKEVTVVKTEGSWNVSFEDPRPTYFPGDCFCGDNSSSLIYEGICHNDPSVMFTCLLFSGILLPLNFAFFQLPGLAFSAIGTPIKACILATDKKAGAYSDLAQGYLKLDELQIKKQNTEQRAQNDIKAYNAERTQIEQLEKSRDYILKVQRDKKLEQESDESTPLVRIIEQQKQHFQKTEKTYTSHQKNINYFNSEIANCQKQIEQYQQAYSLASL